MTAADQEILDAAELESLLPWHAAGTLSRGQTERVDRTLASRPDLARRLMLAQRERTETIGLNEELGTPSARVLATVLTAIAADASAEQSPADVVTPAARDSGDSMA